MASKMKLYIGLLVLGLAVIGTGVWLLLSTPETVIIETTDNVTFQEDFGFRGKQISLEEASNMLRAKVPEPTYLPEGYSVREVYMGIGDDTVILLISDVPIEKITKEPPDKPKDYPIYKVKCEMSMYVSFERDLGLVGSNAKPMPSELVFSEAEEDNVCRWTTEVDNKTASLYLIAKKDVAGKDELIKIAQSVK